MSNQPSRFENYPPGADAPVPEAEPEPAPRPLAEFRQFVAPEPGKTSRRTLLSFAIGLPVVGIAAGIALYKPDPEPVHPAGRGMTVRIGRYGTILPKGWNVVAQTEGRLGLRKGDDLLYALPQVWGTSTLAVEELETLVERLLSEIPSVKGKVGPATDGSTINLQRAALTGTATVNGRSARLLGNLWLGKDGTGLLVLRVLVAEANSIESMEAQGMTDQLSAPFQ